MSAPLAQPPLLPGQGQSSQTSPHSEGYFQVTTPQGVYSHLSADSALAQVRNELGKLHSGQAVAVSRISGIYQPQP